MHKPEVPRFKYSVITLIDANSTTLSIKYYTIGEFPHTDLLVDVSPSLSEPHHAVRMSSECCSVCWSLIESAGHPVHLAAHPHQVHHALQLCHMPVTNTRITVTHCSCMSLLQISEETSALTHFHCKKSPTVLLVYHLSIVQRAVLKAGFSWLWLLDIFKNPT